MKQIIRLVCIVLASATMLVACGKDKDNTPSYKMVFNGQTSTEFPYAAARIATFDGNQCIIFEANPVQPNDPALMQQTNKLTPGFKVVVVGTTEGTYESTRTDDGNHFLLGGVRNLESFQGQALISQNVLYGDWWGKNAKVTITKFDRENGLASFTASGDMFNAVEAILQGRGVAGSQQGTMTITVENMPIVQ